MKNVPLPEHLTSAQKQAIGNLLDKYHPRTLAHSPLIDARGVPIPLHLASTPLTDAVTGEAIPIKSPLERGILQMFTNYPQHLNWERDNLSIRKIKPGEAEFALTGQEGVFAAGAIPPGTPVAMFGGMYPTDLKDIQLDEKIRNMAGIGVKKCHVQQENGTIQGMGVSMKLNSSADGESNVSPLTMNALDRNGEKVEIMSFFTSKPIKAGEELRFNYRVNK